jgi:hypothetical protein
MDILAHMLWTNYGARVANKKIDKKDKTKPAEKKLHINLPWVTFWGVFPDLFAFTIPFVIGMYNILFKGISFSSFGSRHSLAGGFDLAHYLYQYSHSLVIWAAVFIIAWIVSKRPRLVLLGWALHILIDIPSHAANFYPTPFLFPLSNFHYTHGVPWSNPWYMIINYSLLLIVTLYFFIKKKKVLMDQKEI